MGHWINPLFGSIFGLPRSGDCELGEDDAGHAGLDDDADDRLEAHDEYRDLALLRRGSATQRKFPIDFSQLDGKSFRIMSLSFLWVQLGWKKFVGLSLVSRTLSREL